MRVCACVCVCVTGMAAHNYDGDMLTDEIAQIHRSPGFITSNLVGKVPIYSSTVM